MINKEERKRVCCNCGNNLRIRNQHLGIHNECAIDGHYISYSDCFEGWCRHWKKEVYENGNASIYENANRSY